jgi:SAM-dependent methyltransferase
MFEAETDMWWYKILHEKILKLITLNTNNKNLKILDAGCGTGGLITFLSQNGYKNIKGFDYSDDAVLFCKKRNLNVIKADITNLGSLFDEKFDIIICNDVLYQFNNESITGILQGLFSRLKDEGMIISNNQAFDIFSGTHDIAVGSQQRFTISKIKNLVFTSNPNYNIVYSNYWSLFLSPLILLIRLTQKLKLLFNFVDLNTLKSDVNTPIPLINNFFYKLSKLEEFLIKKSPFGSSLIVQIGK